MKLQFDKDLEYQKQAVAAVVDLFKGQTPARSNFTVCSLGGVFGISVTEHGVGNRLELDEEDILKNLNKIQLQNGIAQTKGLKPGHYDFDIEMETGTGKTYVYLRTILELNKN
jgi:type III restriction enzyme